MANFMVEKNYANFTTEFYDEVYEGNAKEICDRVLRGKEGYEMYDEFYDEVYDVVKFIVKSVVKFCANTGPFCQRPDATTNRT